ncbi:hypothetical protein MRX96_026370 [Rhipicephalus microplus]
MPSNVELAKCIEQQLEAWTENKLGEIASKLIEECKPKLLALIPERSKLKAEVQSLVSGVSGLNVLVEELRSENATNPTSLPWTTLPSSGRTRCPRQWASSTPTVTWTSCSEKPGTTARFPSSGGSTRPRSPLNYEGCVAVFCDPDTFKKRSVWRGLLAEKGVWGAFGCHPHMAKLYDEDIEDAMIDALEQPKVVALGEIGLDYSSNNNCDHKLQQLVFRRQLQLASKGKLPLVIHSRDATQDTLRILKEEMPADWPIHRHCFTGGWTEAQQWMDTFPNLFLGLTPLTDAPYFLPKSESNRLKQSHPGMAIHVATQLSAMRGIPLEEVLVAVRQNTRRMYRI